MRRLALVLAVGALAAGGAAAAEPPATPAGEQLAWVLSTLNGQGAPPAAELARRFAPSFLKAVPAAQLAAAVVQLRADAPYRLVDLAAASPTRVAGVVRSASGTRLTVSLEVESAPPNRIVGLLFQPERKAPRPPTSWAAVDRALRGLAAHARLLAVPIQDDRLGAPVHALDADGAGPIGSAFKLYVLGALAHAVADGSARWDEELPVRSAWKSLPSGAMRDEPAGKRFTLRRYATQMISVSDNTATDHLIGRLGRDAVEAALRPLGHHAPALDEPFLTTRELFALKLAAPPALRNAYVRAGTAERRRLLERVDALGLPSLSGAVAWKRPRQVESLEWLASPADLCRAQAALDRLAATPRLRPLRAILSANPGVQLDAKVWPYAAFKGGSEPGVLSLSWLLRRHDGRVFALALVLDDPRRAIDEQAAVAAAEGAIALLADAR